MNFTLDNSTDPTEIGNNRTGIQFSPVDSKKTLEGAMAGVPEASTDASYLTAMRLAYSKESEPVGTMPPPASFKGAATAAVEALKGKNANVFLDMLGARLAYERTGTRLYEGLLVKFDASNVHDGGPTRQELELFRDQELAHFNLLVDCMEKLGADPTAMTPSADVQAVASSGILRVISDPRTTLTQALQAMLTAELTDNDCWVSLADLADELGQTEMADRFRIALAEEREHLAAVRSWLNISVSKQASNKKSRQPS